MIEYIKNMHWKCIYGTVALIVIGFLLGQLYALA
jgi:hypothetical protein